MSILGINMITYEKTILHTSVTLGMGTIMLASMISMPSLWSDVAMADCMLSAGTSLGLGVNPAGTQVYAADAGAGNSIRVVDTATDSIIATIPVGSSPQWAAFNSSGSKAYIPNFGSSTVSIIDTASQTVTGTVGVGAQPRAATTNPAGTKVYVANENGGSVSVISTSSDTVVSTITVGSKPEQVAFLPSGAKAYVVNSNADTVSIIDPSLDTVTGTISIGVRPYRLAVNPAGTKVYVSNRTSGTIGVIDTSTDTVTNTITVGSSPFSVAFSPDGTKAYVANNGSGTISVIDTATETVTGTIAISGQGIVFLPSGSKAYVGGGLIYVINALLDAPISSCGKMPTTTTLTRSPTPSVFGSPVTFSATVNPAIATGSVIFRDGATDLATVSVAQGSGVYVTSALSAGSHSMKAVFRPGSNTYLSATSATLVQVVQKGATTTTLTSSVNPSLFNQSIRFSLVIHPSTATGIVVIAGIGQEKSIAVGHGSGSYSVSTLDPGSYSLTAQYLGSANFAASTSSGIVQSVVLPAANDNPIQEIVSGGGGGARGGGGGSVNVDASLPTTLDSRSTTAPVVPSLTTVQKKEIVLPASQNASSTIVSTFPLGALLRATNMRSAPSLLAPIKEVLLQNWHVFLLKAQGDWWNIRTTVSGKEGYVYAKNVVAARDESKSVGNIVPAIQSNTQVNHKNMRVIAPLRVHEDPAMQSRTIAQLPRNTPVIVLETIGEWYRILFDTVRTGYVVSKFVRE